MKYIQIDELIGNEILAVPIVTSSDVVLLHSETVLKKEYISKLRELGILYVYVKKTSEDIELSNQNKVFQIEDTVSDSLLIVKDILDHHVYKHNKELKKVGEVAEKILESVISTPEIIHEITEIRNISTDLYSHLINVCSLSTIMSISLKMSEKQVRDIAVGAILHDIGLKYISVPYYNISLEEMNDRDALEYKKHTIHGYTSLQELNWLSDISKEIILMHHERENGVGYPFQKNSDKIKQEVKIVSVCDDFDSFISGIGNKKMKIYKAVEYLKVCSGNLYSSDIVKRLIDSVALYSIGIQVITNEGEIGVVVEQNKFITDRPLIRMLKHSDGSEYQEEVYKDLMKLLTVFIVDTIE